MPSASRPIHALPAPERPRERLRRFGVRPLSLTELVAVLVGSGGRGGSALDVAARILERADGSLRRLAATEAGVLERTPGVGRATAARVAAALELGRRAEVEAVGVPEDPIRGPADAYRRLAPRMRHLTQEEFHALLLNTRHRVLREVVVTRGILDASLIHPREVFRPAIAEGAAAVILAHNHPSGDPAPSAEDRRVTRQLVDAGRALGIPVLDHLVVGADGWVSLVEGGRGGAGS